MMPVGENVASSTMLLASVAHETRRIKPGTGTSNMPDSHPANQPVIAGTVDSVVEQLLAFREETGDFNTLLDACMDWQHKALGQRSMQPLAEQVMPRRNQAIAANAPMRRAA